MIKVGDKVLCLKTRTIHNKKGECYEVLKIIDKKYNNGYFTIIMSCDTYSSGVSYQYSDDTKKHYTFNEYFSSIKEIRKLKLKKLNESR